MLLSKGYIFLFLITKYILAQFCLVFLSKYNIAIFLYGNDIKVMHIKALPATIRSILNDS